MVERFPMTSKGHQKMVEELQQLKTVERPGVIAAIAEARAHGDLSENAEYSAAKEKQGFIEAKIAQLENMLSRAEIIDIASLSGDAVMFGATVTLVDEETEDKVAYKLTNEYESNIGKGHISLSSPIARALMGKKKGNSVEVNAPGGIKYYEVLKVEFK